MIQLKVKLGGFGKGFQIPNFLTWKKNTNYLDPLILNSSLLFIAINR